MVRKLTYVGTFNGISKQNNPFSIATFYGDPTERVRSKTDGFEVIQIFLDDDVKSSVKSLKPLQVVEADVRFLGGQNVLISLK